MHLMGAILRIQNKKGSASHIQALIAD